MNIVDVALLLLILLCGISGFRKGFTKEVVSFLGFFIIIIVAFLFKNQISIFLYTHFPFINIGIFKELAVYNILLYEVIAFFLVAGILLIIFRILLMITGIFEKLLSITIILGFPSKILGFIVGLIEGFVWVFILLYVLSLTLFNSVELNNSNFKNPILKNTPVLSEFTKDFTCALNEMTEFEQKNKEELDVEEFNYESVKIMLKYNIVTEKSIRTLNEKGKLSIENIDTLFES